MEWPVDVCSATASEKRQGKKDTIQKWESALESGSILSIVYRDDR